MNRSLLRSVSITAFVLFTLVPVAAVGHSRIDLLPPQVTVNLLAGETGSYQLKVHNGSGGDVAVSLSVTTTQVPPGGSSLQLSIRFPASITAHPGNNFITIQIFVNPSAVPGIYLLTNT